MVGDTVTRGRVFDDSVRQIGPDGEAGSNPASGGSSWLRKGKKQVEIA